MADLSPIRSTRPIWQNRASYLNTPEIFRYTKQPHAHEINMQFKNLRDDRVVGFDILLKGMEVIIKSGICLLASGQIIKHNHSSCYIDRPLPTQKSESFYIAANVTKALTGEGVLALFNHRPSEDWICIKRIFVPVNSDDLSNAIVYDLFRRLSYRMYDYVPHKAVSPGVIKIPYFISKDNVQVFKDGELVSGIDVSVRSDHALLTGAALLTGKIFIDFDVLL